MIKTKACEFCMKKSCQLHCYDCFTTIVPYILNETSSIQSIDQMVEAKAYSLTLEEEDKKLSVICQNQIELICYDRETKQEESFYYEEEQELEFYVPDHVYDVNNIKILVEGMSGCKNIYQNVMLNTDVKLIIEYCNHQAG